MGRGSRAGMTKGVAGLRSAKTVGLSPTALQKLRESAEAEKKRLPFKEEYIEDVFQAIQGVKKFYHAAPSSERNRILSHGLHPAHPNLSGKWGEINNPANALANQPVGIYALTDFERSRDISKGLLDEDHCDIWEIRAEDIDDIVIDWEMCGKSFSGLNVSVAIKNSLDGKLVLPFEENKDHSEIDNLAPGRQEERMPLRTRREMLDQIEDYKTGRTI